MSIYGIERITLYPTYSDGDPLPGYQQSWDQLGYPRLVRICTVIMYLGLSGGYSSSDAIRLRGMPGTWVIPNSHMDQRHFSFLPRISLLPPKTA